MPELADVHNKGGDLSGFIVDHEALDGTDNRGLVEADYLEAKEVPVAQSHGLCLHPAWLRHASPAHRFCGHLIRSREPSKP